jgi:hypothetical protein
MRLNRYKIKIQQIPMIKPHSDDPDVSQAAKMAADIVGAILENLPAAHTFDYGGHIMAIGDYEVCSRCTGPIAEAQAAEQALRDMAAQLEDDTIREHVMLAADLFHAEATAAIIRAQFHNGKNTEKILNHILGFQHNRQINDDYQHSHNGGA